MSATPAPVTPTRERMLALDVLRGLTVAGMLLVNNPGNWGAIYPPLEHAEWNGWTPTDVIFPFFLFIVGITTHLSRSRRDSRGTEATGQRVASKALRNTRAQPGQNARRGSFDCHIA